MPTVSCRVLLYTGVSSAYRVLSSAAVLTQEFPVPTVSCRVLLYTGVSSAYRVLSSAAVLTQEFPVPTVSCGVLLLQSCTWVPRAQTADPLGAKNLYRVKEFSRHGDSQSPAREEGQTTAGYLQTCMLHYLGGPCRCSVLAKILYNFIWSV